MRSPFARRVGKPAEFSGAGPRVTRQKRELVAAWLVGAPQTIRCSRDCRSCTDPTVVCQLHSRPMIVSVDKLDLMSLFAQAGGNH